MKREITPGLVLHMDPDALLKEGARHTCEPDRRVVGHHSFLCLAVEEDMGTWVPLLSKPGIGRVEIPKAGRTGDQAWRLGTYYFHAGQVWTASHSAVIAAAAAGNERTKPGNRNRLAVAKIPKLPE